MTEAEMKAEVRLSAIENLVTLNLATTWLSLGYDDETINAVTRGMTAQMRRETFPGVDAATSDMLASEIEEATLGLINVALERVAVGRAALKRLG